MYGKLALSSGASVRTESTSRARGPMFGANRVKCRSALEGRRLDHWHARCGEPVGPLPAELVAVDRTCIRQRRVERTPACAAAGVGFIVGPRDMVVPAVALHGAL